MEVFFKTRVIMIDKNNQNVSDEFSITENPSEVLSVWLKDHTDPHINPWATDSWKQTSDSLKKNGKDRYPNCIDPTANRLPQSYGLGFFKILTQGRRGGLQAFTWVTG